MLGSISPVGEAARMQRWWLTAVAYTIASAVAGAVVGLALGAAGQALSTALGLPATTRLTLLAAATAIAAAIDATGAPLPTWHRQVDEQWLHTYRGWVYGAGFGGQLGAGVLTIVTSAVTYVALLAALLSGSAEAGAAIGAIFGSVRAVPLLLMAPVRTPERLHAVTRLVARAEPGARATTTAGQAVLAVAALVAAVTA